jgi:hypothetical protein
MQGLKPSVLMGKLKQHLLHGVSPDNYLFLAMFLILLILLPPSCKKQLVPETTKTAVAMVRAANALSDACRRHDPMVATATTHRSRSPTPASGRKYDKKKGIAHSKSRPLSGSNFFSFQNPDNGMCKNHNFYGNKAFKCIFPCSYLENLSAAKPVRVRWLNQHMPTATACISQEMQASFF